MHLGIKVGPDNWREKLVASGLDVRHIEIYYNTVYAEDYPPLYAWMRARGVQGRLHASTPLPGGVFPTLATADEEIRDASAALSRQALDVAADEGLPAVVIHPGSYLIPRLRAGRIEVIGVETPAEEGSRRAAEEMLRLVEYGRARGVEPLFENMPGREFDGYGPVDRTNGVDVRFVPYGLLRDLGRAGVSLCVDVAHLYTELMVDGHGSLPHGSSWARHDGLYPRVTDAAHELAPYAPHLHLSTITPPWNGTDGHSGFLDADYALGAIPGRDQLLALLEPFVRSSRAGGDKLDTWLIPEPLGDSEMHVANYRRLRGWLKDIL